MQRLLGNHKAINDIMAFQKGTLRVINQGIQQMAKPGSQAFSNNLIATVKKTNGSKIFDTLCINFLRNKSDESLIDILQSVTVRGLMKELEDLYQIILDNVSKMLIKTQEKPIRPRRLITQKKKDTTFDFFLSEEALNCCSF